MTNFWGIMKWVNAFAAALMVIKISHYSFTHDYMTPVQVVKEQASSYLILLINTVCSLVGFRVEHKGKEAQAK